MIEFVTKGLYTAPEAAALLREKPSAIRRWAFGYHRRGRFYEPAIATEVPTVESERLLTFVELVELLSIQGLLSAGFSWNTVRDAAQAIRRLLPTEKHPFARRDWFIDPGGLYLRLAQEQDVPVLIELAGDGQVAIEEALRPYLHQLEFNREGLPTSWFPLGLDQPVVVDPRRSFGAPIIMSLGVRTSAIHDHYLAGDSIAEIAAYFDAPEHEVASAIRFQTEHAA